MIGAVREMSENIEYIEDVTREDGKIEKIDIERTKTKRKENLDDSYDIYSDAQFKEIMEKQLGIASILENNLTVIQSSLKKKKVEETHTTQQNLNYNMHCIVVTKSLYSDDKIHKSIILRALSTFSSTAFKCLHTLVSSTTLSRKVSWHFFLSDSGHPFL